MPIADIEAYLGAGANSVSLRNSSNKIVTAPARSKQTVTKKALGTIDESSRNAGSHSNLASRRSNIASANAKVKGIG